MLPHSRAVRRYSVVRGAGRVAVPAAAATAAQAATSGEGDPSQAAYWPQAYSDLMSFTFWGTDPDRAWTHGSNDIFNAIAASGERGKAQASALDCKTSDQSSDAVDPAFAQIEQRVQPTEAQRTSFEALRAAVATARQRINVACAANFASASPPDRLRLMGERLRAMRQALAVIRTPLDEFYGQLSDAQKAQFDGADVAAVTCGDASATWSRDQMAQALRPSQEQFPQVEAVRLTAAEMSGLIAKSCPAQAVPTALERLDALNERLNSMLYAANIVGRQVATLYGALNDRQRGGFGTLARAQRAAAAAPLTQIR